MNELESLFKQQTGEKLLSKEELSASGSNRRYFRLESKSTSLIGVAGTSTEENKAFIEMAKHFGYTYFLKWNGMLHDLKFNDGEVEQVAWFDLVTLESKIEAGEFCNTITETVKRYLFEKY